MIGMFSPELEKLIEFTLADGRLTDQERALLETAAKKEGVDMNQLEVYIQYRLYQRKEEEIKQAEARKYNEPIGKVKRCPKCFELLEDQYRFCPKCQTPVADDSTADTAVNLGNANAICGGVNINRSKNITSCDTHYHSTTINERIKSDAELKLDAINQLRSKTEEVIGERGRIDSIAITQLRHLASQLGIDEETFKTTIKEVRSNRSGCTSGLSSINARYLSQAQQAVQANNIESLSGLFPRLEAIAAISQDDNVQYLYYLALSLLYPTKSIEVYEQQTDENYWRTFWAIITYIKVDNWAAATRELANLQPALFEKAEEDLNVLEALFNLVKKDKDCAQDFLDDILGETSPQIAPFLRAIEIALYEEECESPEVRFYSEQVIAKICSADEAKREQEEVRARAESLKFSSLADDYYFGRNGKSIDYEKAVEYYRKAAEQGDADAQFKLGCCYEEGEGVEQSAHEAVKWYRKAAEAGHAEAQYDLGECYYWGVGVEESAQEAVKWYRKAAEQGLARAQSDLGDCYEKGKGVEQSAQEAVKWYRKAAEQGDANGQYSLGECYEKGEGVEQSAQEAVKWYRKAAEQGDADAQFKLGCCHEEGEGVEQSAHEAVKWYRKAAEQEHDEAIERLKNLKAKEEEARVKAEAEAKRMADAEAEAKRKAEIKKIYNLGEDYYFGRNGKSKDYKKAVEYYRKAAEQGLAEAQCDLGYCYESGRGVEKSAHEAVKWYRKAAEQGYARAQCNLGYCYNTGLGIEKSAHEAVKWYRKAAEQGFARAQSNLGLCYEKGEGVEQSAHEAEEWYRKAADQGYDKATERLKNLKAKEEAAKRKAEEEARKKAEEEAAAEAKRKAAEEEAKRKAEAEAKRKAEEEARKKAEEEAAAEAKRKAAEAEHTEFDVILKSAGAATLGVVKAVKESTGLSLKESKEIVAKAPVVVMKNVSKTEAEALKAALEEAGAEVEIKGPKELLDLLEIFLTDGIITEKERKVLIKKATALGVDPDEFDLYIDAQVQKLQNASAEVAKQTEPYITIDKLWVETDGVGLLYFHCDWTAYNLKSESIQMRLNMAAKSGKKIKRDASLNEYYFLNDKLAIKKDVQKFKNTILRLDHYELKMTHNEEKNLEFTLEFVNDATGESYHISKKMYISVWIYLNIFSSNKFEIRSQKIEL